MSSFANWVIPFSLLISTQSTLDKDCTDIYLTDLTPIEGAPTFVNQWTLGGSCSSTTYTMEMGDGQTYDQFLMIHPPSTGSSKSVTYNFSLGYDTFTAVLGLAGTSHCNRANPCYNGGNSWYGSGENHNNGIYWKLYVDSVLILTTSVQNLLSQYETVEIDMSEANELTIISYNNGDFNCDHAVVANPLLTCHSWRPTTYPTIQPTVQPSINPTYIPTYTPTYIPTYNPTEIPTYYPTYIPTHIPTYIPTNNPTFTDAPTYIPTYIPTYKPSITPTNTPVKDGNAQFTTTLEVTDSAKLQSENDNLMKLITDNILWLVIICVFVLLICILGIIFHKRKKQKEVKHKENVLNTVEMGRVQSTTEITSGTERGETGIENEIDGQIINGKEINGLINDAYSNKNTLKYWLNDIGMGEYFNIFVKEGFGDDISQMEALSKLTDDQLKSIGISKLAHRNIILSKIEKLYIPSQANPNENDYLSNNDQIITPTNDDNISDSDETEEMFMETGTNGNEIETQTANNQSGNEYDALYKKPTKPTNQ